MESKDVKFRRTLLASAISLAFAGASGFAVAADTQAGGVDTDPQTQQEEPRAGGDDPWAAMSDEDPAVAEEDPAVAADDPAMPDEDTAMAEEDTAMAEGEISEQEAEQLVGQSLQGPEGEELGQIDRVVRDDQDQLALVVSEGGTLGIGGTERVVELEQIDIQDQQATLRQDDLAAMPEFQEEQYETVASAADAPEDEAAADPMLEDDTAEFEQEQTDEFGTQ